MLSRLIARREPGLAPQAALPSGALGRLLQLERPPESVGGLGQPAGRLLYLGYVIEYPGSVF